MYSLKCMLNNTIHCLYIFKSLIAMHNCQKLLQIILFVGKNILIIYAAYEKLLLFWSSRRVLWKV